MAGVGVIPQRRFYLKAGLGKCSRKSVMQFDLAERFGSILYRKPNTFRYRKPKKSFLAALHF